MRLGRTIVVTGLSLIALVGASTITRAEDKLPGVVRGGEYASGLLGTVSQPAPETAAPDALYAVGPWPTYAPPLADGPGKATVQGVCSICHNTTYITMQPPLPAATWQAEVTKMIKAFGAPISDETAKTVVDYLSAHYTPETRRQ